MRGRTDAADHNPLASCVRPTPRPEPASQDGALPPLRIRPHHTKSSHKSIGRRAHLKAPSAADSGGLAGPVPEAAGKASNLTGAAPCTQSEKCQLKQFFFFIAGRRGFYQTGKES